MQAQVTVDKLIAELFALGKGTASVNELLERSGEKVRELTSADRIKLTSTYQKKEGLSQLEEFVINTGKPYVDNRLGDYSAFQDLVKYYNSGFKSCALLPSAVEGRSVFILTLLSRQEDAFSSGMVEAAALLSDIIAYEAVARIERERSISLARYFDAAFDPGTAKLMVDRSGSIVKANKAMAAASGLVQRELNGKNVRDLFDADADVVESLARGGSVEARSKRNPERFYRLTGSDVNEKLMLVTAYDITDLKMLDEEAKLANSSTNDAFLLMDKDTRVIWATDNVQRILKMRKEMIVGGKLADLEYGDRELAGSLAAAKDAYTRQMRINAGNDLFVDVKATFLRNAFGGFSCVISSNSLEKRIGSMQKVMDELIECSGDVIMNVDTFGYVNSANMSAEKILGYARGELRGMALNLLYADKDSSDRTNSSLALAKKNGVVGNVFVSVQTKGGGGGVPCEQTVRSITDAENGLVGYMIMLRELGTKRMNDRLQEAVEKLTRERDSMREESTMQMQFINDLSHDLKTPLTNIKGFAKLLSEGRFGELSSEQSENVGIINTEADRLMELIMQILDVAKLASSKIKLDLQPVNLTELAKTPSLNTLAEVAKKKGLEFSWNIDYNVPEIQADPNRLIQVFANLIGNAIKFTDKGSIRVNVVRKGKSIRVEVADTGIGISREDRSKIFKKFYQLQRKSLTKQEGSGTGLGLSIAKGIVNLHGGKMHLISEPGKGSTFWFTLPISGKQDKKHGAAKQ